VFLSQRELNEVYLGGIGSYALLTMTLAFLQLHPSRQPPQLPPQARTRKRGEQRLQEQEELEAGAQELSLGVLLTDFFRLYGRTLNFDDSG
jgi:non-canonical poly(A) RNA polymerase PAPD5/7